MVSVSFSYCEEWHIYESRKDACLDNILKESKCNCGEKEKKEIGQERQQMDMEQIGNILHNRCDTYII